jgi:SAM-dependent methyltransferase
VDDLAPTVQAFTTTLERARRGRLARRRRDGAVDPYVQKAIVRTCGGFYRHLEGRLPRYPIPILPLPPGDGRRLLDVGCNWGRWTVAADRRGYRAVGIDPSVEAVAAARRVAEELDAASEYVVADARRLPFADESFDVVFSYSVLQHLTKDDTLAALGEVRRVLKPGGRSLIEMANLLGARNLAQQIRRRRFRDATELAGVRYWTPRELVDTFRETIGPTTLTADAFLSLNAQRSDLPLMPRRYRALIRASLLLTRASGIVPGLRYLADSVWLESRRA